MASTPKTFLHLIGKTGTGKSSTGNSILGKKIFQASSNSSSDTVDLHIEPASFGGWDVVVVDGPGLIGVDASGFSHDHWNKFKKVCEDNPDAGHVFLLVCRYGERFTAEDSALVAAIRSDLGWNVFEKHGVVLVTCGDNFEADHEDESIRFDDWCIKQGGDFAELVKSCGNRVLLVDNTARGAKTQILHQEIKDRMPTIRYGRDPFQKTSLGDRNLKIIVGVSLASMAIIFILYISGFDFSFNLLNARMSWLSSPQNQTNTTSGSSPSHSEM